MSIEVEAAFVVERIRAADCPLEEIAILCRTNARLADFEQALHEAGIPSQGASLLGRDAARFLLRRLREATARWPSRCACSRYSRAGWRRRPKVSASASRFARTT